jgi:hypothetical protein
MPMPGADKTTEAKEGVLTYMRAWGGTFSLFLLFYQTRTH